MVMWIVDVHVHVRVRGSGFMFIMLTDGGVRALTLKGEVTSLFLSSVRALNIMEGKQERHSCHVDWLTPPAKITFLLLIFRT